MIILNLCPWPVGGFATYIKNLYHSYKMLSVEPVVLKLSNSGDDENFLRTSKEGVAYRNVGYGTMVKMINKSSHRTLLAAHHPKDGGRMDQVQRDLVLKCGVRSVVHDPNDLRKFPHVRLNDSPIVIRETMLEPFPRAAFIPHPYFMHVNVPVKKTELAGSLAMVTSLKNPTIILRANRMLKSALRIKFLGIENRLYTRNMKEGRRYPEYPGSKGFPRGIDTAVRAIMPYIFNVDMSIFPGDGGGTQYSFLEAMDGGAVNILTEDWCAYPGPMKHGRTCLEVGDEEDIADILMKYQKGNPALKKLVSKIRLHCHKMLLTTHSPGTIVPEYLKELQR